MKKQFKIYELKPKSLLIGDKVRLIDGSSLTCEQNPVKEHYIIYSYEGVGSNEPLKELDAEVIETNIEGLYCEGVMDTLFKQDIKIKIGSLYFFTSSKHVHLIDTSI